MNIFEKLNWQIGKNEIANWQKLAKMKLPIF